MNYRLTLVLRIVTTLALLVASASPVLSSTAFAEDAPSTRVGIRAPTALFVDGVKVGSTQARLPKLVTMRTSRCTSGCTIMITN